MMFWKLRHACKVWEFVAKNETDPSSGGLLRHSYWRNMLPVEAKDHYNMDGHP